jgi:hypothetical protein
MGSANVVLSLVEGRLFPSRIFNAVGQPELYLSILGGNQRKPVFALGFRIRNPRLEEVVITDAGPVEVISPGRAKYRGNTHQEWPAGADIPGTEFTYNTLDGAFPYGWRIFMLRGTKADQERTYIMDKGLGTEWLMNEQSVKIRPNFVARRALIDLLYLEVKYGHLDDGIVDNRQKVKSNAMSDFPFPMIVGKATGPLGMVFGGRTNLFVSFLGGNELQSAYVIGWAIRDIEFTIPIPKN